MTEFYKGDISQKKGCWERAKGAKYDTAMISCPKCGKIASLTSHTIADDGAVTPSLVCPHDCGFHDHAKLLGWEK